MTRPGTRRHCARACAEFHQLSFSLSSRGNISATGLVAWMVFEDVGLCMYTMGEGDDGGDGICIFPSWPEKSFVSHPPARKMKYPPFFPSLNRAWHRRARYSETCICAVGCLGLWIDGVSRERERKSSSEFYRLLWSDLFLGWRIKDSGNIYAAIPFHTPDSKWALKPKPHSK